MPPSIIALTGLPGTGKTRFGATLYPLLPPDVAYLDIDTLTQPLVQAALAAAGMTLADAAANGTLRRLRDAQYACLWNQVRELVAFRRSVFVVAPMTHELDDAAAFLGVVESLRPARFILMRTHASPATVRARLERRCDFLDPLRLARWEADLHRYERPAPLPVPGFELDTTERAPQLLADVALRWLRTQLEPAQVAGDVETQSSTPARIRA